jgi:primosomal protein N''
VRTHQQTIALFQQEATSGADPQLSLFAQRMLPMLQQHLAQAQEFEQRLAVAVDDRGARSLRRERTEPEIDIEAWDEKSSRWPEDPAAPVGAESAAGP